MVCSPPGSSLRGILQARILEWVAFLLQGIFLTRDKILASHTAGRFFTVQGTREGQWGLIKCSHYFLIPAIIILHFTAREQSTARLLFKILDLALDSFKCMVENKIVQNKKVMKVKLFKTRIYMLWPKKKSDTQAGKLSPIINQVKAELLLPSFLRSFLPSFFLSLSLPFPPSFLSFFLSSFSFSLLSFFLHMGMLGWYTPATRVYATFNIKVKTPKFMNCYWSCCKFGEQAKVTTWFWFWAWL